MGNKMLAKMCAAVVAISVAAVSWSGLAEAQVKIGVMVSSTGPASIVGIPQKKSVPLLPTKAGGETIEYIVLDDGGVPATALNNAKKLILEDKVDGLIGPSLSPNAMAVLDFVSENKVPMIAAVGTDAVIFPMDSKRRWMFKTAQANSLILTAEVNNMRAHGVKTVGILRLADALGEEWVKSLMPLLADAGMTLVADERFQRRDVSVVAQALHIVGAKPDAVLVAAAGATSVLGGVTLRDKNYKGLIYQTNGAASDDFPRQGGEKVENTLMAAGPLQVVNELSDSNPIKAVALKYIADYQKLNGDRPSTFGSNVYDAGLLIENAIPRMPNNIKPGTSEFRSALRDALETTKNVVGTQGIFNMTAENHNGLDTRAALMMTVSDGKWRLLKSN